MRIRLSKRQRDLIWQLQQVGTLNYNELATRDERRAMCRLARNGIVTIEGVPLPGGLDGRIANGGKVTRVALA